MLQIYNFLKFHYSIESTDKHIVYQERCRRVSIITESQSRCLTSTTIRIPLGALNSNNLNIPSLQPPKQSSATKSQFRTLKNIIKSSQTWKFEKKIHLIIHSTFI